jgi:small subunit ribosomal protein S1
MSEPVTPEPAPQPASTEPSSPAKPTRRAGFDAEIERELEAALAGMDDKALYGESQNQGRRAKPAPAEPKKRGKVVALHGDDVFVDIGGRSQGVLTLEQFPEGKPEVGQELDVTIEGYDNANGLLVLSRKGAAAVAVDWSSVAEGMIVEARVTGTNKGGLAVDVNGIRGFIPVSQIDLYRVEDTAPFVNQKLLCIVTEANAVEKNLVLSRRELLEREREEMREKLWQELAEGQIRMGLVRNVKEFGAFLDLGGVDGLLPASEMAWNRVDDPSTVATIGQQLRVVVLRLDREKRKITLGLKQLLPSPWDDIEAKYSPKALVSGKVTKLMDFGAFVELEPGIEGLIHNSELSTRYVRHPREVVQPGQQVQVTVLKVDPTERRISLSMKAAAQQAEGAVEPEQEREAKRKPPRKKELRGGL